MGLVAGLSAIVVRCTAVSEYALGARVVKGDGELCIFGHGRKGLGEVGYICVQSVAFRG